MVVRSALTVIGTSDAREARLHCSSLRNHKDFMAAYALKDGLSEPRRSFISFVSCGRILGLLLYDAKEARQKSCTTIWGLARD